jgi:sortase (surface protein transpeptidase)
LFAESSMGQVSNGGVVYTECCAETYTYKGKLWLESTVVIRYNKIDKLYKTRRRNLIYRIPCTYTHPGKHRNSWRDVE